MEQVPVLVVGGGGAGLTSSMLLSRLGVEHLLVSAQPTTSTLPKAHVLNQRAVEILDDCGACGEIRRRSTPPHQMAFTAWYSGLGGRHPDDGRVLARQECWGAGGEDESWRAASAFPQLNLPQIRLEPVLKARAEELAPGKIRFGHELVALAQDAQGVTATILDRRAAREYQVRARYLVAADGGRTIPERVGIGYEGFDRLAVTCSLATTQMRALSALIAAAAAVALFGLPYRLNIVAAIVVAVALSLAIEPRLRKPHGGGHA